MKEALCDRCLNYRTLRCPCGIFDKDEPRLRPVIEGTAGCCDYKPRAQLTLGLDYFDRGEKV